VASLSEFARQRGVSKQSLSRQVLRFEDLGLIETREGERGQKRNDHESQMAR